MRESELICLERLNVRLATAIKNKETLYELVLALRINGFDMQRISDELEISESILIYGNQSNRLNFGEKVPKPLSDDQQKRMFRYLKID